MGRDIAQSWGLLAEREDQLPVSTISSVARGLLWSRSKEKVNFCQCRYLETSDFIALVCLLTTAVYLQVRSNVSVCF